MSSIKIGSRVIVIDCENSDMICPKLKEEVCIVLRACTDYEDSYILVGYEKDKFGNSQSFHSDHLRIVDEKACENDNFAENLLSELTAEHLQEEKIREEINEKQYL